MDRKPYGLICSITHACEVLEPRWTIPILTEMWGGSTRFNQIRRGVGSISPALLSRRLKELEDLGLIERVEDPGTGTVDYFRTEKAVALEPALDALAKWALENLSAETALDSVSVSTLVWKLRNVFLSQKFPNPRNVLRFHFNDDGLEYDTYYLLVRPGEETEVCSDVPGYDVDLYVETSAASLTSIVIGRSTVAREVEAERLFLSGDTRLVRGMQDWIKPAYYAEVADDVLPLNEGIRVCGSSKRVVAG